MTWEDVFFSRDVDPKDIIKALARIFEIEEQAIGIEYGWAWQGLDVDHISMLCRLDIVRGDFPIRLEFGFWSGWRRDVPKDSERYAIVGRLCDLLNNPALVTGDSPSPYIWTLIQGEADYQYVSLDGDKLDQPDLMEIEIDDYLYKFTHNLSEQETNLGLLLTSKYTDQIYFQERMSDFLRHMTKENLIQLLNKVRPEAKRMYREDWLQQAIDSFDNPLES